mgnify:FL=1
MAVGNSFGKPFMFIAWGLAIALLVWFFQDQLQEQFNPNSHIQSHRNGGDVTVVLEQNRMGHYVARGKINGQQVTFLLDTGATLVAVPEGLASQLGLQKGRQGMSQTANGRVVTYRTEIDTLELGEIRLNNVDASITPGMDGNVILLGMSALKEFELTQKNDTLRLTY